VTPTKLPGPEGEAARPELAKASRRHADSHKIHRTRQAAWLVFGLAAGVFLIRGSDRPKDPKRIPAGAYIPSAAVPGFGEVGFKVAGPGVAPELSGRTQCALLARTVAQQQKGLMNRRDLAGYQGMVFQFDRPTVTGFYMKDTLISLSIAWFDQTGGFVSSTTMSPCPKNTVNCPIYSASGPYTVVIETRQGGLSQLGIGPGSTITVGGPC
jgi:uncharacterized membrane protein (UPF0127 family)